MTKEKVGFTPGPWHVEAGAIWAEAQDGSNLKIGSVHAVFKYVSLGERNNNLRLMAAAPDLYEALKELLRVDEAWHGSVNSEMSRARNAARAALAKVEQP